MKYLTTNQNLEIKTFTFPPLLWIARVQFFKISICIYKASLLAFVITTGISYLTISLEKIYFK